MAVAAAEREGGRERERGSRCLEAILDLLFARRPPHRKPASGEAGNTATGCLNSSQVY